MREEKDCLQHLRLLSDVKNMIREYFPEEGELSGEFLGIWEQLRVIVGEVNAYYFKSEEIAFNDLSACLDGAYSECGKTKLISALEEWLAFITETDQRRRTYANAMDRAFYEYMDRARYVAYDVLLQQVIDALYQNDPLDVGHLEYFYEHFHGFWGMLNIKNDNYEVIESRVKALKEHWQDFIWTYERLSDYRSKFVLFKFIEYWFTYNRHETVDKMREYAFKDYYDLDLLHCDENEVIADLGAYIGDSILDYANVYGEYKKAFCFEVSPWNVAEIEKNLAGFHDVTVISKAAGEKKGVLSMAISPEPDSCNSTEIEYGFETEVEVTTVDEEIKEPLTLIKMDIEGAEQSALLGCKEHILNDHPKLLICVYHNNEDIWKIPKMIYEIRDDYDFYLRSNGDQWGPSEIVLFALPRTKGM